MLSSKPQVNAQVGKENNQEVSTVKVETGTTNQKAEEISNDTSYQADIVNQITNQLTWWQMLFIIVIAGAALPSFKEMYAGVKIVVGDVLHVFIVIPSKAISKFILILCGKTL